MALTGTPWRSDNTPIVLSDYCTESGKVHTDYRYGLGEATSDGVCRMPRITAVDNSQIRVSEGTKSVYYSSFNDLLSNSACRYQDLLENDSLIIDILSRATSKLNDLRKKSSNAGGLIVATSVSHAQKISHLLYSELNESSEIATYAEDNPLATIRQFRNSKSKWIISVGMISEGTNLPRLQVCCYLTRVKTELYFRQVLGRILRTTGNPNENGYLFMPAEPTLIEYAQRVSEDIPESNVLKWESTRSASTGYCLGADPGIINQDNLKAKSTSQVEIAPTATNPSLPVEPSDSRSPLAQSYEASVNISGYFIQKLIEMNCNESSDRRSPSAFPLA